MEVTIDTSTMSPYHEFSKLMSNARSLKVKIGSETHEGTAVLSDEDGDGHLVLAFKGKKAKGKK